MRLPRDNEIGVDLTVLGFAAGTSLLAALISGVLPALQAGRTEIRTGLLIDTARGAGGAASRNRSRSILVIAEVSLSFVLLIGAGLLIRSFISTQAVDPGFDSSNVMTARLSLPKANYKDRAAVSVFADKLSSQLQALPGVESVGAVSLLPMGPGFTRFPSIPKARARRRATRSLLNTTPGLAKLCCRQHKRAYVSKSAVPFRLGGLPLH